MVHIKLCFVKAVILGSACSYISAVGQKPKIKLALRIYLGKVKFAVSSNPVVENNQAVEELELECVAWADAFVFEVSFNYTLFLLR